MKKRMLLLSILCLLFVTINYTYSAFQNTIVGDISATSNNWYFVVNVTNGILENDYYKVPISGTSGSFDITLDTTNNLSDVDYSIELLSGYNLPSDIKYYSDSSYSTLISGNYYTNGMNKNTSKTVTIYYKSSNTINGYACVRVKGNVAGDVYMKNGNTYFFDDETEFWSNTYRPYIKTITFDNDLSNMPSICTEENLCWDISDERKSFYRKVYGYLVDSGSTVSETDSSTGITVEKTLYNLYIVSEAPIFAPSNCSGLFAFIKDEGAVYTTGNLETINFNNNFNTSNVTNMSSMFAFAKATSIILPDNFNTSNVTDMSRMFHGCKYLTSLNLNNFNTLNVTNMSYMFDGCKSLTSLNLNNFNTLNVTNMSYMFSNCKSLTSLDLSNFNTSSVTTMSSMFENCTSLTTIDLRSFDTSKVTTMSFMFEGMTSLTSLDLSNFNTSSVTNMSYMFENCSKLTTTINIMNTNVTYSNMFSNAATDANAQITVNYINDASSLVDSMIATKSSTSNVVKGTVIS